MKLAQMYKLSGTAVLAISLAVLPFNSSGQAQTEPEVEVIETEENSFDWGWLGLLGLLGLAGLAGKNSSRDRHDARGTEDFPTAPANRTDSTYR